MKRTTVFVEEHLESDLQAVARRQKRPVAALVREALQRYVAAEVHDGAPPLRFVGVGGSGRSDTAEQHEEQLWKELTPHTPRTRPARRRKPRAR
jgi:predicted transcriptional regulator